MIVKSLIIGLIAIIMMTSPALACDVNLFAIISGVSKHDAFSESMNGLATAIKSLGDSYTNKTAGERELNELMNLWVKFSSSFAQFPPQWANDDPDWQKKFVDLGNIIGEIRRYIQTDKDKAHINMLRFSRRLPQLYVHMPMSEQAKILLQFTACFDNIWEAFYAQDLAALRIYSNELKDKCKFLEPLVPDKHGADVKVLAEYAEQLRIISTQINAFKTVTLQMIIINAEGQFVVLNGRISNDSTTTTDSR